MTTLHNLFDSGPKSRVLGRRMKYNNAVQVASLYEFRDKSRVARWRRHVGMNLWYIEVYMLLLWCDCVSSM